MELICDKGDELTVRGFSLGIADGIAEKSLQSVQIASVPGHFDGVTDGAFYSAGRGLEGLCHLRVEHLGDGISLACGQQEASGGGRDGFLNKRVVGALIGFYVALCTIALLGLP